MTVIHHLIPPSSAAGYRDVIVSGGWDGAVWDAGPSAGRVSDRPLVRNTFPRVSRWKAPPP